MPLYFLFRISFFSTASSELQVLVRRLKDGQRFGPKLARDGGRIFQSSSRDVETIIRKKGLSEKEIDRQTSLSPSDPVSSLFLYPPTTIT